MSTELKKETLATKILGSDGAVSVLVVMLGLHV